MEGRGGLKLKIEGFGRWNVGTFARLNVEDRAWTMEDGRDGIEDAR
jgi:hypothetical protein